MARSAESRLVRPFSTIGLIGTEQKRANHCRRRSVACSCSCTGTLVSTSRALQVLDFYVHSLDASDFLRKHPWPGRSLADTFDHSPHRKGLSSKKFFSALKIVCGKTGEEDLEEEDPEEERALFDVTEESDSGRPFYWSRALQQSFREELEK